jgi:hypothetical protein
MLTTHYTSVYVKVAFPHIYGMVHNEVHKDNCTSPVVLFAQDYGPYALRLRTKFHTVQISPSSVIYNPDPLRSIFSARDLQQKSM